MPILPSSSFLFLDGSSNRVEAGTDLDVVNFDIAGTLKQKVGVALPTSTAPLPKGDLTSSESLKFLAADSVGR